MTTLRRTRAEAAPKPLNAAGLTVYVAAGQIDCDWLRLTLFEKEIDNARVNVVKPGRVDEDLLLLNPSLSLPTLVDREGVLHGAAVLVEYVDERYPQPRLMPAAPAERARARMVLRRIEREIFPLVGQPAALLAAIREGLDAYERRLAARGWFMGADFTLTDCAWAVLLRRLPPAAIAAHPSIRQYAERLFGRPAFRRYSGAKAS